MRRCFAPMEGITTRAFREAHAACFPRPDRYYLPFLSPTQVHSLTPKQLRELTPGLVGLEQLVPQLLTKNAQDFLWAAGALAELGFTEVNLNLGCPSGTVVAKGKGAGMLRDVEALDRFLDQVCAASPLPVSVKTRLGLEDPAEFDRILPVLSRYPLRALIIHPRTRRQLYAGQVHSDRFEWALGQTALPLCYNGDLFTRQAVADFAAAHPGVEAVMLGRGLLMDAALCGAPATRQQLETFHGLLCDSYLAAMDPDRAALPKLKELWAFLICRFTGAESLYKQIRKARRWQEYAPVARELLTHCPLANDCVHALP